MMKPLEVSMETY